MKRVLYICLLLTLVCMLFACKKEVASTVQGGEQDPSQHTHEYGEWEVTLAPTCLAKGEEVRHCACGESDSREIALLAHSAGEWEIAAEADFRHDGLKQKRCTTPGCTWVQEQQVIPAGTVGDALAEPAQTVLYLNRAGESESEYVIVYDYKCSRELRDAIAVMQTVFLEYFGTQISVVECYSGREGAESAVQAKEILIGRTDRAESAQVMNGMRSKDYALDIIGKKLVIAGGSDTAVKNAIAVFLLRFAYEQGDRSAIANGEAALPLLVGKNVAEDAEASPYDVMREDCCLRARYTYEEIFFGETCVQDFALIYASGVARDEEYKAFAEELQTRLDKLCGVYLDVKKDTDNGFTAQLPLPNLSLDGFTIRYGDDVAQPPKEAVDPPAFGILIGDTCFGNAAELLADEYHIALQESTDATGCRRITLTVLFGEDAYDAALDAFLAMLSDAVEAEQKNVSVAMGFVSTNQMP